MRVERREAPAAILAVIAEGLSALAPDRRGGSTAQASEPLPLYGVDTELLLDGGLLNALAPVGWRAIILDEQGVSFADVEDRGGPNFARRVTGAPVHALIAAAALANSMRDEAFTFELRVVESPELKTAALWLAGDGGWFLPYSRLAPERIAEAEFLELLAQRAERQRRAYEYAKARLRSQPATTDPGPVNDKSPKDSRQDQEGDEP